VKLVPSNHGQQLSKLTTLSEYQNMAMNGEFLGHCEELLGSWCQQIVKVLTESEQIRREADDTGPYSELAYWKQRMAKFNNLLEQIKSQRVRACVGVLQAAKSKSLNKWKEMDAKITDAANEARDNVKYLYTLDKFFSSMTKATPAAITESIPSLMNAVRMIHSISQYYNSSERMTSLFLKITNQMINTCRKYIKEGYGKLWDIPRQELLEKINQSKKLFVEYQNNFHKTREKLKSMENERQWDFSENYIFGKFEAFCKRLDKIADVIVTIESLSALNNVKIEGLESIIVKYKNIVENIRKKNYDTLDHRKIDFENDYSEFKNQIDSLQQQLQGFIDTWSRNSYTAEQSLEFLEKFQRLDGVRVDYNNQYSKLLQEYSRELETVRKLYEKNKTEPTLSRNLPPISGRIAWARQLYRRISNPIKKLSKKPEILKSDEGKAVVRNFNKMSQVLLEYELVHYRSWVKSIEMIKSGLAATVLVKDSETHELFVNFDPQVQELLKETVHFKKMNLEIPDDAKNLLLIEQKLDKHVIEIRGIVDRYKRILDHIPKDLVPLIRPNKENVEIVLKPGLIAVTWMSTNIEDYIRTVNQELDVFENINKQIRDILECRVETVLSEMSTTSLCEIPLEPCTIEEFIKVADETAVKATQSLAKFIGLGETAVNEILDTLKKNLRDVDKNLVRVTDDEYYECLLKNESKNRGQRCQDCLPCSYFNFLTSYTQRNNDALIQCTRYTFDSIKKRLQQTNKYVGGQVIREKVKNPLFKADIILAIPNIAVKPTLDDMQSQLNKAVQAMLKLSQDLPEWNHSLKIREAQLREIEKQAIEEGEDAKAAVAAKAPKQLYKIIAEIGRAHV